MQKPTQQPASIQWPGVNRNRGGAQPGGPTLCPRYRRPSRLPYWAQAKSYLFLPSSRVRRDSSGLRKENGRGNSILQGCVLCVLTMQKETEAPGLVFPAGRAQEVTQCCHLSLSCLCAWCPVTSLFMGAPEQHSFLTPLFFSMLLKGQVHTHLGSPCSP